jgi:hypothetical protein
MRGGEAGYILARIAAGEGQTLDFKQRIDSARKIAKTLVAFANSEGGSLLIGVKDNGRIVGIAPEEEYYMIDLAARRYTQPVTAFTAKTHIIDNKAILEVHVPPQPEKRPLRALEEDGRWRAYVRISDQTRLAGSFLEAFWEAQKKPQHIRFRREEELLLRYLREHPTIDEKAYRALLGPRHAWKARRILIKYLLIGLLVMDITPTGEVFRLVS